MDQSKLIVFSICNKILCFVLHVDNFTNEIKHLPPLSPSRHSFPLPLLLEQNPPHPLGLTRF